MSSYFNDRQFKADLDRWITREFEYEPRRDTVIVDGITYERCHPQDAECAVMDFGWARKVGTREPEWHNKPETPMDRYQRHISQIEPQWQDQPITIKDINIALMEAEPSTAELLLFIYGDESHHQSKS